MSPLAPNEDIGAASDAGAVNVIYGASSGITSTGAQQILQSHAGGATETGDRFGAAVASS
jgi:hypothetical protein